MPNQQPTYREQVDAQRIIQIREILKDLPQACGDFIRSIAVTTGTFTRLAYAIDLRTFFTFLQRERVAFADTPLTHLTDQQIGSVTQSDLTAYIEYLTYYFKEQDADEETAPLKPLVNHELAIKRKLSAIRSFYELISIQESANQRQCDDAGVSSQNPRKADYPAFAGRNGPDAGAICNRCWVVGASENIPEADSQA